MKIQVCSNCKKEFPAQQEINGEMINLNNRKVCLDCLPYKKHNTDKSKICKNCGGKFPQTIIIDGKIRFLNKRSYCLDCSPFGTRYLQPNELIEYQLTDIQEQVLNGHMLGDGHLSKAKRYRHACFVLKRKESDYEYLLWSYNYFQEFMTNKGIRNTHSLTDWGDFPQVYFRTKQLPVFTEYHNKWYIERNKIIPKDLILTPLTMAVWFADDGCVSTPKNTRQITTIFCTHSFTYDETNFLANQLYKKYDINALIYKIKDKEQYKIEINRKKECIKFFNIIDEIFPLKRKADKWRDKIY
jgi:hypothetical protein